MSNKSNNQGRAYEFAHLITLFEEISKIRPAKIEENSSYFAAERAWNTLTDSEKTIYKVSALAGVKTIFDLEPLILDDGDDDLELKIQSDDKGKAGDVRDVLIIRRGIGWEIGLSVKHNHFAVKHSRLSKNLDFGRKWYGVDCSEQYWEDIKPIFEYLDAEKQKGSKWSDLPNKEDDVYIPLLNAFKGELERQNHLFGKDIPKLMVEYLLGEFDFYKVIGIDSKRITRIQSYNLRGTLNNQGNNLKRSIELPISTLPTRIVSLEYKPDSKNTLELYLDGGWQFSFRIHNASTKVEPSLKFDIQIIGMPTTIISIDCRWK
ncbi:HaeIII family restriction endonuclease [Mesomycoplasma ovipneumoniae]|uniref:HaeIII family restriction endonuclease n=1 Tax=Mesomycoplasma ovipneumoniae TaxID=29562 RepID=A0AAJ2PAP9_9BACT|nr:HaeIII family restriction endonuclease [Mesomycoplasma ovipneumoniae]MDW2906458.1 HaeIII family restriction endonuclease [Mesomycoplasma ovipneumoniae]MDW2914362.1 HaeIII family restriction endonuclease [Mesomycoplasma ovipneumoniae]